MDCGSCRQCPAGSSTSLVRLGDDRGRFDYVVALAGNPNTGKSTVFNALTGLRQHTGNWPGKTVARAEGAFSYNGHRYKLVDLPGTYSLMATSVDEEIARNFVLFGRPQVTIIVADAGRLERNLNLVLQVLEITDRAVLCLNLMDEAQRHGLSIDVERLEAELGIPVVATSARFGRGIDKLLEAVDAVATGARATHPRRAGGEAPGLRDAVAQLAAQLDAAFPDLNNTQWIALRLLDGDAHVTEAVQYGTLLDSAAERREPAAIAGAAGTAGDHAREVSEPGQQIVDLASSLRWEVGPRFHQALVETIYAEAARIADAVVRRGEDDRVEAWDKRLDRILTSPLTGYPIMIGLFLVVIWLTVVGANYPSSFLAWLLVEQGHSWLKGLAAAAHLPGWLDGLLIDGAYLATAWVISVMLPPMAIFFPLFTLAEDFGYLPRVAFNLDRLFRAAGAHGKQALTMTMGFGCNAAGVVSCRVIDSPRERLLAIITNNFSLCNGRWPTQILIATIFLGALVPGYLAGVIAAGAVVGVALLGVGMMFLSSWLLSRTVLRGEVSTFHLELPPYRPPRILQTLYTSLIDRTIFILWRAVLFALPAGLAIWLVSNIPLGDVSLAEWIIETLDPLGLAIGLNGVILLAYIIAIPANEIVIPTVLMLTVLVANMSGVGAGSGVMFETDAATTKEILQAGGWTVLTGVCLMLFSLLHNPCSTTIYTIYKETGSARWTLLASLFPLALGFLVCFATATVWRLLAG